MSNAAEKWQEEARQAFENRDYWQARAEKAEAQSDHWLLEFTKSEEAREELEKRLNLLAAKCSTLELAAQETQELLDDMQP